MRFAKLNAAITFPVRLAIASAIGLVGAVPVIIEAARTFAGFSHFFGESTEALQAVIPSLINSVIWGSISSLIGSLLTWGFLLNASEGPVVFFILATLLFPGAVSALGFQYAIAPLKSETLRITVLLISLTGFIIPYQLVTGLWFLRQIPREERLSVQEFYGIGLRIIYWAKRLWQPTVMVYVIGLAMAVSEVPRSHYLGVDAFGHGRQFLEAWMVGRFNSVGFVAGVFPLVAFLISAIAVLAILNHLKGYRTRNS